MPSPNVILKEFLKGKSLDQESMKEILEGRRQVLARFLDKFTLETLGQMACLDGGNGLCHEIALDTPEFLTDVKDGRLSLETQGMFAGGVYARRVPYSPEEKIHRESSADGVYNTFGLSRRGEWLGIKIEFDCIHRSGGAVYEKASSVLVLAECGLWPILAMGIDPHSIYMFFSNAVEQWVSTRERLYKDALKVAERMREEDAMMALIKN